MLPSDADNVNRILSSISFSCFLLAALWMIIAWRSSSRSGLEYNKITLDFNSVAPKFTGMIGKTTMFENVGDVTGLSITIFGTHQFFYTEFGLFASKTQIFTEISLNFDLKITIL
jgi:hypothetical protein